MELKAPGKLAVAVLAGTMTLAMAEIRALDAQSLPPPKAVADSTSDMIRGAAVTKPVSVLLAETDSELSGTSDLDTQIRKDIVRRQRIIARYRNEHPELKSAVEETVMEEYLSQLVNSEPDVTEGEMRRYYDGNLRLYAGYPYERVRHLIKTKLELMRYLNRIANE